MYPPKNLEPTQKFENALTETSPSCHPTPFSNWKGKIILKWSTRTLGPIMTKSARHRWLSRNYTALGKICGSDSLIYPFSQQFRWPFNPAALSSALVKYKIQHTFLWMIVRLMIQCPVSGERHPIPLPFQLMTKHYNVTTNLLCSGTTTLWD